MLHYVSKTFLWRDKNIISEIWKWVSINLKLLLNNFLNNKQ